MKVLGQSIQVPDRPYVHLGYLAATTICNLRAAGFSLVIAGIVTLMAVAIRAVKQRSSRKAHRAQSKPLRFRRTLLIALLPVMIIATGTVMTKIAGPPRYVHPRGMTAVFASVLLTTLHELPQEQRPANMADVRQILPDVTVTDGWDREMQLSREEKDGQAVFVITSAGKDGAFGTEDDIRRSSGKTTGPADAPDSLP
ncbi:MAG: hypothetical protein ACYS8X_04765 [Planctomycetota bacterium]|jgi:hypothetical protein